jgi:hypothetical protein
MALHNFGAVEDTRHTMIAVNRRLSTRFQTHRSNRPTTTHRSAQE